MNKKLIGALVGAGIGFLIADWYVVTYLPIPKMDVKIMTDDERNRFEEQWHTVANSFEKRKETDSIEKGTGYNNMYQKRLLRIPPEKISLQDLARKLNMPVVGSGGAEEVSTDSGSAEYDGIMTVLPIETDETDEPIVVITRDEFINQVDGYKKRALLYYTGDEVITDDRRVPVENAENFIGEEALLMFGQLSPDGYVHIRNETTKTMYEIKMIEKNYRPNLHTKRLSEKQRSRLPVESDEPEDQTN